MQIIPAVNAASSEEAVRLIEAGAMLAPWIHLDVVDGRFAQNRTWGSVGEFRELRANNEKARTAKFEIHLMVENPEMTVRDWFEVGADRVVVHAESVDDWEAIRIAAESFQKEVFVAVKPETPISAVAPFSSSVGGFQVLAVPPGRTGQPFDRAAVEKVRALRQEYPGATIEVDGGVNLETGRLAAAAGASILVAASYIFGSPDPKEAYEALAAI
jgi:ribulose-phosphate 3-epimerase